MLEWNGIGQREKKEGKKFQFIFEASSSFVICAQYRSGAHANFFSGENNPKKMIANFLIG